MTQHFCPEFGVDGTPWAGLLGACAPAKDWWQLEFSAGELMRAVAAAIK